MTSDQEKIEVMKNAITKIEHDLKLIKLLQLDNYIEGVIYHMDVAKQMLKANINRLKNAGN